MASVNISEEIMELNQDRARRGWRDGKSGQHSSEIVCRTDKLIIAYGFQFCQQAICGKGLRIGEDETKSDYYDNFAYSVRASKHGWRGEGGRSAGDNDCDPGGDCKRSTRRGNDLCQSR